LKRPARERISERTRLSLKAPSSRSGTIITELVIMASCAVLYATLLSLSVPHFLAPAIAHASKQTEHCLSIVLVADAFDPDHSISHTGSWNDVQQLLTFVYVQATKVAQDMDRLLMSIDVLLKGPNEPLPESVTKEKDAIVYRVEGGKCLAISPEVSLAFWDDKTEPKDALHLGIFITPGSL
jgi:hypothetical protein